MTTDELKTILNNHAAWLNGGKSSNKANLCDADLRDADLCGANLCGANLTDTRLDPSAPVPAIPDVRLAQAGFTTKTIRGRQRVYGWRTQKSQHCGVTIYIPNRWYVAPWFSVDMDSYCHPGIYLAGREYLRQEYPTTPIVRCWCYRDEMVCAGGKFRAKRIYVLAEQKGEER